MVVKKKKKVAVKEPVAVKKKKKLKTNDFAATGPVSDAPPVKKKLKTKDTSTKGTTKPPEGSPGEEKRTVVPNLVNDNAITVAHVNTLPAKSSLDVAEKLFLSGRASMVLWAAALHRIKEKGYYKDAGFETYKDYVEGKFHKSIRAAQNYVENHKVLHVEYSISPETLIDLGHNKALILRNALAKGILDKDGLADKIAFALEHTEKELKSLLNGVKKPSEDGKDGQTLKGDEGKQRAWDFSTRITSESAIEVVQQAKEKMDAIEGQEVSQATFLERLAMEYMASTIEKHKKPIQYFANKLKHAYPEYHIVCIHNKHAEEFKKLSQSLIKKTDGDTSTKGATKVKKKGTPTKDGKPKVKKEK